jgi:nitric oxide reductase NorQ protein
VVVALLVTSIRQARSVIGSSVSGIGWDGRDPVPTGLHVLDAPDYPGVPKAASHLRAGDNVMPGEVGPPAIPTEPRLRLPLDELLAKKLACGLVPVRPVGHRGSGKN